LNIYAGQTVTGVNTSGNGGSSFWIHGPDIFSNGNNGFVQITVVPRVVSTVTLSSNTSNYTLTVGSIPGYVAGNTDVILVVNSGVSVSSTSTASSALLITGLDAADTVTLTNNGTIVGAGGAGGFGGATGVTEESGNTDGPGYGGDNPVNPAGSNGASITGGNGSVGGVAISMNTNSPLRIENNGTIVGGGGGAGGDGGNNVGGGSGGNGGNALQKIVSGVITLDNRSGAVFAGGGGGGSGWGNRSAGSTEGGAPGQAGFITSNGGGNFGAQGAAGRASTDNATTIFTGAGTHTL
jgi:hypothetical protein